MIFTKLEIPKHIKTGVMTSKKSASNNMYIYGGDSETCAGPPFTYQFYGVNDGIVTDIIVPTNTRDATKDFLHTMGKLPQRADKSPITIYIHNLEFDMPSFFYDRLEKLRNEEFNFKAYGWNVEGVYANVCFATLSKGRRVIRLIDSYAFFKTSLAKIADILCPDLPKLKRPEGLGEKIFPITNKKFRAYAMRDSEIAYHIGVYLQKMHIEFDVPQSFSGPHFASRVFRRQYVKQLIPLPPRKIVYAAMHSYHGGKNNLTVKPGWYSDIKSLDIISAYPWAMRQLPSFYHVNLYREIDGKGHPNKPLPYFGIYKVYGRTKDCPWPIIYSHHFKPIRGEVDGVWTTGAELNEALATNEIEIDSLRGYYYDADNDTSESPFVKYIDTFFKLKDTAENPVMRWFYKVCLLNSLYGKFIQTRSTMDNITLCHNDGSWSDDNILVAGGLFNPFIASMITGIVRARIHQIEHKYKSIHTSTDGIFTQAKDIIESSGLGGLKIETQGDVLIIRNKVYAIYGDKPANPDKPLKSSIYEGKYIQKYALHGFHGTIYELEQMAISGVSEYEYVKVNKLRESLNRGLVVNKFEKRIARIILK